MLLEFRILILNFDAVHLSTFILQENAGNFPNKSGLIRCPYDLKISVHVANHNVVHFTHEHLIRLCLVS